jgi:hypothetical protein
MSQDEAAGTDPADNRPNSQHVTSVSTPVPFLVGSGRTGLTLLRVMFDSHPEMAMAHEARFLPHMASKRGSYERPGGVDLGRFVDDLYGFSHFRRLQLARPELENALAAMAPSSFSDAVRAVWELYVSSRGKKRYGEKAPLHISHMPLLADLFPEARFVHVIRDGRDVAMAYIDAEQAAPRDIAWAAFHWRLRVSHGREAGGRLGPDRYREFRYEDLVTDPVGTVRAICDFVDLDYHEDMLHYRETAEEFLVDARHPADHQHLVLPPTAGLIDWRTRMSGEEVALFEAIAGDLLADLGYEPGAPRRASKRRVWIEWARWQWRRVTWRLKWRLGHRPAETVGS